jgi:hypothetical protein
LWQKPFSQEVESGKTTSGIRPRELPTQPTHQVCPKTRLISQHLPMPDTNQDGHTKSHTPWSSAACSAAPVAASSSSRPVHEELPGALSGHTCRAQRQSSSCVSSLESFPSSVARPSLVRRLSVACPCWQSRAMWPIVPQFQHLTFAYRLLRRPRPLPLPSPSPSSLSPLSRHYRLPTQLASHLANQTRPTSYLSTSHTCRFVTPTRELAKANRTPC